MTESIMLINETDDECRIAIVENGILQEMLIEHSSAGQIKNNIYKGTVVQVQTSLQAAFLDYGDKKHGFLPNSELNPILFKGKKHRKHEPIQNKISVGQELIVQVTREAANQKGSALTTYITLPGRFMVLMPNSDKGGVSKKIEDAQERERLKGFLSGIEAEEHSVIIRTAGLGRSLTELKKDYTALKKTWNDICSKSESMNSVGLILEESDVVTRTLRDYYTEEIKEVWVDNPETFQKALAFFKEVAPRNQKDLKLFVDERSLFATYHIERQVEQLTSKQVKLKSGGSIVIDQTEALVAIDVNSGRSNQEGNIDSTALRTNLEAAEEIARQLRLRNLGGLIVIDFIDMENESYRKQVEDKIAEAMEKDKAQLRFNQISQFGLLELSRQRLSVGISSTVEATCPVCNGKGKIPSLLASTNLIIRSIRELAARGNVSRIEGELPLELVNFLLNDRRQSISDLELEFDIDIILRGDPEMVVFNERFLKPVYDKKTRPFETPQKKDPVKSEPPKKWQKKQNQKKDSAAKRQPKNFQQDRNQPKNQPVGVEEIVEQKPVEAPVEDQAVKAPQQQQKPDKAEAIPAKSVARSNDNQANHGIHPSCLFTDVRELEDKELEEVTTSFGNRLKGKIDNQPTQVIDNKYLWKSQNGNKTTTDAEQSISAKTDDPTEIAKSEVADSEKPERYEKKRRRSSSRRRKAKTKPVETDPKAAEATAVDKKEDTAKVEKDSEKEKTAAKNEADVSSTDTKELKNNEAPKRTKKPTARKKTNQARSQKSTPTAEKSTATTQEDSKAVETEKATSKEQETKEEPVKKTSSRRRKPAKKATAKTDTAKEKAADSKTDSKQAEKKEPAARKKTTKSSSSKTVTAKTKSASDKTDPEKKPAPKPRSRAKKKAPAKTEKVD